MMQVRCQRCGWMLTLGRDAIAWALAQAQQGHEQYHMVDCPRCRHAIKIQISQLRRRLPANYPLPEIPPATKPEAKPEPESGSAPATEANSGVESPTPPAPAQTVQSPVMSGTKE